MGIGFSLEFRKAFSAKVLAFNKSLKATNSIRKELISLLQVEIGSLDKVKGLEVPIKLVIAKAIFTTAQVDAYCSTVRNLHGQGENREKKSARDRVNKIFKEIVANFPLEESRSLTPITAQKVVIQTLVDSASDGIQATSEVPSLENITNQNADIQHSIALDEQSSRVDVIAGSAIELTCPDSTQKDLLLKEGIETVNREENGEDDSLGNQEMYSQDDGKNSDEDYEESEEEASEGDDSEEDEEDDEVETSRIRPRATESSRSNGNVASESRVAPRTRSTRLGNTGNTTTEMPEHGDVNDNNNPLFTYFYARNTSGEHVRNQSKFKNDVLLNLIINIIG